MKKIFYSKTFLCGCLVFALLIITASVFIVNNRNNVIRRYTELKRQRSECDKVIDWIFNNLSDGEHVLSYDGSIYKLGSFELSGDVSEAFRIIDDTFNDQEYLDYVEVRGSRVFFWSFGRDHALVYSPNRRPWKVDEKFVFSQRICKNWYHVTRK